MVINFEISEGYKRINHDWKIPILTPILCKYLVFFIESFSETVKTD